MFVVIVSWSILCCS